MMFVAECRDSGFLDSCFLDSFFMMFVAPLWFPNQLPITPSKPTLFPQANSPTRRPAIDPNPRRWRRPGLWRDGTRRRRRLRKRLRDFGVTSSESILKTTPPLFLRGFVLRPGITPLGNDPKWFKITRFYPKVCLNGCGSKLKSQSYACFSLWFHLPSCNFGTCS